MTQATAIPALIIHLPLEGAPSFESTCRSPEDEAKLTLWLKTHYPEAYASLVVMLAAAGRLDVEDA